MQRDLAGCVAGHVRGSGTTLTPLALTLSACLLGLRDEMIQVGIKVRRLWAGDGWIGVEDLNVREAVDDVVSLLRRRWVVMAGLDMVPLTTSDKRTPHGPVRKKAAVGKGAVLAIDGAAEVVVARGVHVLRRGNSSIQRARDGSRCAGSASMRRKWHQAIRRRSGIQRRHPADIMKEAVAVPQPSHPHSQS